MTLDQAIEYAINQEGLGIIKEPRLINYLTDLQAFDSPALKSILSSMLEKGHMSKFADAINSENNEIIVNETEYRLVNNEGFQQDLVRYVLDCFVFAFHKTGNAPHRPPVKEKQTITKSSIKNKTENKFNVIKTKDRYLIELNGASYELNEGQFQSIMRKKDLPLDRLELWLKSYTG